MRSERRLAFSVGRPEKRIQRNHTRITTKPHTEKQETTHAALAAPTPAALAVSAAFAALVALAATGALAAPATLPHRSHIICTFEQLFVK